MTELDKSDSITNLNVIIVAANYIKLEWDSISSDHRYTIKRFTKDGDPAGVLLASLIPDNVFFIFKNKDIINATDVKIIKIIITPF